MAPEEAKDITNLLNLVQQGHRDAEEQLFPLVYEELQRRARRQLRGEAANVNIETKSLVHEAYIKLTRIESHDWQNRGHFFAVAAKVMRQILIDHGRARKAKKRGGLVQVELEDLLAVTHVDWDKVLLIHRALEKMEHEYARQARVVEMRFFGGMDNNEIASVLGVSLKTVVRDWDFARSWLLREIAGATMSEDA